jgi:hypothetical protein
MSYGSVVEAGCTVALFFAPLCDGQPIIRDEKKSEELRGERSTLSLAVRL